MNDPRLISEICPECRVEFKGRAEPHPDGKWKCCPQGHWTTVWRLGQMRKYPAARETIFAEVRQVGIRGQVETYQLALAAMVAAGDKALETLPMHSVARSLVAGAIERPMEIAKRVLGMPA
jgi:hypothetical protein